MTELEKVIKGLECCSQSDNYSGKPCKECPYNHEWRDDQGIAHLCKITQLRKDALFLLQAQEPRVMTIEEVRKHYALPPVVPDDLQWQTEYLSNIAPLYFEYKQANSSPSVHWRGQREAQHCLTHWAKVYGSLWRCWTSRPTDEQREKVKWE